jgi:hypothetical protein
MPWSNHFPFFSFQQGDGYTTFLLASGFIPFHREDLGFSVTKTNETRQVQPP